jgi:hypothetical protein
MEKLKVKAGLELLLQAAEFFNCKYIVESSVVIFERELEAEECLELELSGAEFNYLYE